MQVIQRIACFLAVSRVESNVTKIVFPPAEIMLPFVGVYTRASPRTLHNISYPAAVSFGAGLSQSRAWVREYNPVTQVRRRNSDASAILGRVWNDGRKLRQPRRGSETRAFTKIGRERKLFRNSTNKMSRS